MKKTLLFALICIACVSSKAQAPSITSFSPASGPVGTLVTITGTNLSTPTTFTIGGVAAIVVSNTGSSLVGMVMPGAATGNVSVTTAGGTATGAIPFTLTHPLPPTNPHWAKLTGSDAVDSPAAPMQGCAVALSADGNTAIVGGYNDSNYVGAAWVYTRSGGVWSQQGPKLVGTGGINGFNSIEQGWSVSLSADGNTALVGAQYDNSGEGATWVYTRSGTTWAQQGPKLVGTGGVNSLVYQGRSVYLSADGNTAIIGAPQDHNGYGATWVFTRSGNSWTQQGPKLIGTGATIIGAGGPEQGVAVALSADGNTAMIGGNGDSSAWGAAWIFTRSGGVWTQQGHKLVGSGAVGAAQQGFTVALSADGNTAMMGGSEDNSGQGAVWVFTRSGTTWTQQGPKLVANSGLSGPASFGTYVSLSADGNTALIGAGDSTLLSGPRGATYLFKRSGGTWAQQGSKWIGPGAIGAAFQGYSVFLSADGSTAIEGGLYDNNYVGAAWIFSADSTARCSADSSSTRDSISSTSLPYMWNGLTFTGSGTQTAHLSGSTGCDSLATLVLTVLPTGINAINSNSSIHLYPNPNNGSFTLETTNSIGTGYTITDMLGSVIEQKIITADTQIIDINQATEGVYTLEVNGAKPVRFVMVR
jgi:Secretion system C-terminal sorting domain/IPT/TIG domain